MSDLVINVYISVWVCVLCCSYVWSTTCHEQRTVSPRLCTRSRSGAGNLRPDSPAQSSDPAPPGTSAACDWSLVRMTASDWSWHHITCVISPGPAACPPPWARPLCSAHSRPLRSPGRNTGHCHSPARRSALEWGPVITSVVRKSGIYIFYIFFIYIIYINIYWSSWHLGVRKLLSILVPGYGAGQWRWGWVSEHESIGIAFRVLYSGYFCRPATEEGHPPSGNSLITGVGRDDGNNRVALAREKRCTYEEGD